MARNTGIKQADYNNLKNVLMKTDDGMMVIQRPAENSDTVYFANGHVIARFPYCIYAAHMDRNNFPELEPGKTIIRRAKLLKSHSWNDSDMDLETAYKEGLNNASRAVMTKLTMDVSNDLTVRLIVCGNKLAAINSRYFDAARRIAQTNSHVFATGSKGPVIILDREPGYEYYGFFILPIHLANKIEKLRDFIAA